MVMAQSSKINKYIQIKRTPLLAASQPETNVYAPGLLPRYLEKYKTVFVKPDRGLGGIFLEWFASGRKKGKSKPFSKAGY
jgi:hypothetical protein